MTHHPKHHKHTSETVVCTPPELLAAVEKRFGPLAWDLAATADNAVAPNYITPEEDSLSKNWGQLVGTLWCNPPFANIEPWVQKAATSRIRGRVLMLLPAGVGTRWFRRWVVRFADVFILTRRVKFVGQKYVFPKDLLLLDYPTEWPVVHGWDWKTDLVEGFYAP